MAADPDSLELGLAAATHFDMLHIVETEKKLRKKLLDRVRDYVQGLTVKCLKQNN